jgi:tRNA pseudouridine32 synthase/23S rRNA pseudouridine746 synthase
LAAAATRATAPCRPDPPPLIYDPPTAPLRVLHADADCIVLDKPPGLLSVPGKSPELADCLERRAQAVWPDALTVHRLDLATSGVCIMARGKADHRHLSMQFARRHVAKVYIAQVQGTVWAASGLITLPLRADWPRRPRQMVDPVHGKPAVTAWRAVADEGAATRLALQPITGRSHQLRVHLAALGHPITGDPLYGAGLAEAPRMMLHASSLTFRHPSDGRFITLDAAMPF